MHQKTPTREKPPIKIRIITWLTLLFLICGTAAGVRIIWFGPDVITSREVVMMPNDTVQAMREEMAVLRAENETLRIQNATRLSIIRDLTGPMQGLTDSMLALSRLTVEQSGKNGKTIEADALAREQRYTSLLNKLEKMAGDGDELKTLLAARPEPKLVRDTIYATLPERRSWLAKLLGRAKR